MSQCFPCVRRSRCIASDRSDRLATDGYSFNFFQRNNAGLLLHTHDLVFTSRSPVHRQLTWRRHWSVIRRRNRRLLLLGLTGNVRIPIRPQKGGANSAKIERSEAATVPLGLGTCKVVFTNWQLHTRFRLAPTSTTFDDLERSLGIAGFPCDWTAFHDIEFTHG